MHLHAVLILQGLARLDAHEHLLGGGVLLAEVVHVVGGHQGDVQLLGKLDQRIGHLSFALDAMVLNLQEIVALAHDALIASGHGLGLLQAAGKHQAGNISGEAGG